MLNSEERKELVIEAVPFASGDLHVIYQQNISDRNEISPTETKYIRLTTKSVSF
jgi:hypothetical protein